MYKLQKFFNYMTLILAVVTVISCFYVTYAKKSYFICVLLLILTLIFNSISRVYNNKDIDLTKEDKVLLEDLKKQKKEIFDKNNKK